MAEEKQLVQLFKDSYLAMINNSIGTIAFRNYYAVIEGKKVDVAKNGLLSCAYFVSSILSLFKMIKTYHLTVESTVKDMNEFGWKRVPLEKIRPGHVIVWTKHPEMNIDQDHIGFYSTNNQAISTNSRQGFVWVHPINADHGRGIEAVYRFTFRKNHTK